MTEEEKKQQEQQQTVPTTEQPAAATEQPAEQKPKFSISDFLAQIETEKEQREADDAAAERRGKLREMIGSIGDAAVALNNMMYVGKGATHVEQPSGMGDKARERNEKDKAWREKNRAAWLNFVLNKAGKMQQEETQKAITERENTRLKQAELRAANNEKKIRHKQEQQVLEKEIYNEIDAGTFDEDKLRQKYANASPEEKEMVDYAIRNARATYKANKAKAEEQKQTELAREQRRAANAANKKDATKPKTTRAAAGSKTTTAATKTSAKSQFSIHK